MRLSISISPTSNARIRNSNECARLTSRLGRQQQTNELTHTSNKALCIINAANVLFILIDRFSDSQNVTSHAILASAKNARITNWWLNGYSIGHMCVRVSIRHLNARIDCSPVSSVAIFPLLPIIRKHVSIAIARVSLNVRCMKIGTVSVSLFRWLENLLTEIVLIAISKMYHFSRTDLDFMPFEIFPLTERTQWSAANG